GVPPRGETKAPAGASIPCNQNVSRLLGERTFTFLHFAPIMMLKNAAGGRLPGGRPGRRRRAPRRRKRKGAVDSVAEHVYKRDGGRRRAGGRRWVVPLLL